MQHRLSDIPTHAASMPFEGDGHPALASALGSNTPLQMVTVNVKVRAACLYSSKSMATLAVLPL